MNNIKLYLEAVQNLNSDKEIKLKNYQNMIQTYNAKKDKLKQIFNQDENMWEELANKEIDDNVYLGGYWKIAKIENTIKKNQEKINTKSLTQDEIVEIQTEIQNNTKKLKDEQRELDDKIKKDLNKIQAE